MMYVPDVQEMFRFCRAKKVLNVNDQGLAGKDICVVVMGWTRNRFVRSNE
jgi:hypothetical protein